MSSPGGGGSGGGGTIIINNAVSVLSDPNVQGMLPGTAVRNAVKEILARGAHTWTDDDRWLIGQALAWAICNVK